MQITARVCGVEVSSIDGNASDVWSRRNAITGLASSLINAVSEGVEQVDCPVKHHFAPGVYIREIFMPEDTLIVGKIHKTTHFNEIISGSCKVVTPESGDVKEYSAGDIFISEAGVQKVVYNTTDVVWRTVHCNPDNTESIEELENICIAKDYSEIGTDVLIEKCKRLLL